jgi:RHS repeat-associated protein
LGDTLDNYVDSMYPTTNYDNFDLLKVGTYNGGGSRNRSFISFNDSAIKGQTVTSATLNLYEVWSYACTPTEMLVEGAGAMGPGTTWNTQPALDGVRWGDSFFYGGNSACPATAGWKNVDVTGLVQNWDGDGYPSPETAGLVAANETDNYQWKKFCSANPGSDYSCTTTAYTPYISATYNPPPSTPTALVAYDTDGLTPRVTAVVTDPGGGNVTGVFSVSDAAGTVAYGESTVASGGVASFTVPIGKVTSGGTYWWYARACATTPSGACSADTAWQTFTVNPMTGAGDRPFFNYQDFTLGDTVKARVNTGSGNFSLEMTHLTVPGISSDLKLGTVYNSLSQAAGSNATGGVAGNGWRVSTAPDLRLVNNSDQSVTLYDASGYVELFGANTGTGKLTGPPGADADLVRNSDGSYQLTMHSSQEKYAFRSDGLLTGDTDRNNNTIRIFYDSTNPGNVTGLTGTRGRNGRAVFFSYQADGHLASFNQNDEYGFSRTTSFSYDSNGFLTKVTEPDKAAWSFVYGTGGDLLEIVDPLGHSTDVGYDPQHRVAWVTRGDSPTGFDYGTAGHVKVVDPDSHPPTDYSVDFAKRVTSVLDGKGQKTATSYTADSNVASTTNAQGQSSSYSYGANGGESLTGVTGPTGATSSAAYGCTGSSQFLPSSSTDTMGHQTTYSYDGAGNRGASTNAAAATAALTHNPDGTVSSSTDPNNGAPSNSGCTAGGTPSGNYTRYDYDSAHQLVRVTPPTGNSLGVRTFSYDAYGRKVAETTGTGVTRSYSYDLMDRVTSVSFSDGTPQVSYVYDATGNVIRRSDGGGSTAYSYDALRRLVSRSTTPLGVTTCPTIGSDSTVCYGYDEASNLTSVSDGRGTTKYHYDKLNLLDQLTEASGRIDLFAYNGDHKRTDSWFNTSGANASATYDSSGNTLQPPSGFAAHSHIDFDFANRLTRTWTARQSSEGVRVVDYSYCYSPYVSGQPCPTAKTSTDTANRQWRTDNSTGQITAYSYDKAGRLTKAAGEDGTFSYSYDADGNRTTGPEGSHSYNSANELTDPGYSYDPNGNLTRSPDLPTLAYNGADQTISITPGGSLTAVSFAYNGVDQSERTAAGATSYTNSPLGVLSQTTGTASYFLRDPEGNLLGANLNGTNVYYALDGLGSTTALVDTGGYLDTNYRYDPYGNTLSMTGDTTLGNANPYRYASGYLDTTTGLYKFGQRYYQPTLGRWTQQDNLEHIGDLSQGNRYAYAGDSPATNSDPSGASFKRNAYYFFGFVAYESYFEVYEADEHVFGCNSVGARLEKTFLASDVGADVALGDDPYDENAVEPFPRHTSTVFHTFLPGVGRGGVNLC